MRLAEPRRPARSSVSSITFCITSIHVCRCCLSTCAASAACDHVSGELGHHFFDRAVRVCEGLDLSRGERVARRGYIWAVFVKRVTFFGNFLVVCHDGTSRHAMLAQLAMSGVKWEQPEVLCASDSNDSHEFLKAVVRLIWSSQSWVIIKDFLGRGELGH